MASNSAAGATERLVIREARKEDLTDVYDIETLSFGSEAYEPFLLQLYFNLARETFLVAEVEGRVIGYAIGVLTRWGGGHVISIAVHPSFRRMGVAEKLLRELLKRMRQRGAKAVRLEVKVSNEPAINLYKKLGFRAVGVISNYYPNGEDAYVMMVDFDENG
ncbi:MAG: ribosomal protein S18-alanine N-acetyltransferase [Thermofilaceae archaeon]